MQLNAVPLFCSAVVLLMVIIGQLPRTATLAKENSSCGEYFGDFPQQIHTNRRGGGGEQEVDVINYDDKATTQTQAEIFTVNLALLLPSKDGEGCDECVLRPVIPVIELAIQRSQAMLNEFLLDNDYNQTVLRFRMMFGDTKCSSTVGPLVAVEMVTKARPGRTHNLLITSVIEFDDDIKPIPLQMSS